MCSGHLYTSDVIRIPCPHCGHVNEMFKSQVLEIEYCICCDGPINTAQRNDWEDSEEDYWDWYYQNCIEE